mgnify:CR=1 FL=1|jgi:hypothetical protein
MDALKKYVASFIFTNPTHATSPPDITIRMTSDVFNVADRSFTWPTTEFLGVEQGTRPFKVVVAEFTTKFLSQSSPFTSATNTFTLSLAVSVDLESVAGGTKSNITLSPLPGVSISSNKTSLTVVSTSSVGVGVMFCTPDGTSLQNVGVWDQHAENGPALILHICDGNAIKRSTTYEITFAAMNQGQEQTDASPPKLRVDGKVNIPSTVVSIPNQNLLGVENGANPLRIIVPQITAFEISQSEFLADRLNQISVKISSNIDLTNDNGAYFSLCCFPGAILQGIVALDVTVDVGPVPNLCSDKNGLGGASTGFFTPADSRVRLYICPDAPGGSVNKYTAGQALLIGFNVTNPHSSQNGPKIKLSVDDDSTRTLADSWVLEPFDMQAPNQTILGVVGADNPMTVVQPEFIFRHIGQSSLVSLQRNTLELTLAANIDVSSAQSSVINIANLDGADLPEAVHLSRVTPVSRIVA